jgi:hypothetical protein
VDTVAEVLSALDAAVERALDRRSRAGYFATIYRKVTARIAEGISSGFFDDAERIERLDVLFASRYLEALEAREAGVPSTRSWEAAFDAAGSARPIILQHLLVGINAHINVDLGIAAAATAPGDALPDLRRDFDRVNEILGSLVAGIGRDLAIVSPWIGLLDRFGGRHDDELIRFSLATARTAAWRFAVELAPLPVQHWPGPIAARDTRIASLARTILHPGDGLAAGLLLIRARESRDVRRVIHVLQGVPAPDLAVVDARVRRVSGPRPDG